MKRLTIRTIEPNELPLLAQLNAQLIVDEGSMNPMNLQQLEQRATEWLSSGWNIDFLCTVEKVVGYAVYQYRTNPFANVKAVIIDVLEANPAGKRFWEKVGFSPYYTNMRMEKPTST